MAQNYKAGLIITGDASGGIRAIKATEDELGKLNQGFDRGSRQSKRFGSDAARAGQQVAEIDKGASVASRGLDVLHSRVTGVAAAIATAFGAGSIVSQARLIADTDSLARSIGIATGELQAWDYAAQQAGLAGGKMGDILKDITERIGEFTAEGTGEASALFENLNLSIEEMKRLAPDQQLLKIADAISTLETRGEQISYLERLGSDATLLLPLLDNNAAKLRELTTEAKAMGVSMSQIDIENALEANRAISELSGTVEGLKNQVVADLGPGLAATVDNLSSFIEEAGGASRILNEVKDVATATAAIMAGRYAAAFVASAQEARANAAATAASTQANVAATGAARAKAAELVRVARSEQAAAQRAFENSRAIVTATGNTTLRTRAIAQMAAANQRAIAAEAAHTAAVNASTAAMGRGTAAAQAMTVASRGLNSALTLVGGPLGLLIGAGGLLYVFRDELNLTSQRAGLTEDQIRDLRDEMKDMSQDDLSQSLSSLNAALDVATLKAASAREELANLRNENRGSGVLGFSGGQVGAEARGIQAVAEAQERITELNQKISVARAESARRVEENANAYVVYADRLSDANDETRLAEEVTKSSASATREAAKETTTLARSYDDLLDRLNPNRRAARQYAQDQGVLNLALATGRMNTGQYMQAMGRLHEQFQEGQRETEALATTSEETGQRIAQSFTTWGTVADNTLRSLDDAGRDTWLGFADGSTDALETVERGFQQTFANIAHMLTTQKLTFHVAGMMGLDTTGMPGGPGSSGGGLSLGNMSSLYNGAKKLPYVGDAISSAGSALGFGASAGTAAGYSGALGAATATGYGGALGSAVQGAAAAGSGGFMATAGAAMPWLAGGLLVDNVLGLGITEGITKGISKLFGGGETKPRLNISTYESRDSFNHDSVAQGALGVIGFGKGSRRTDEMFGSVEQEREWLAQQAAIDNVTASAARSVDELDAMKRAVQGFHSSTAGAAGAVDQMSVRTLLAIEAIDEGYADSLRGMGLSSEQLAQRVANASSALQLMDASTARLNLQFDAAAAGAMSHTDAMAQQAGGVDNLSALMANYYQQAHTETERAAHLQDDLTSSLQAMGMALPENIAGFRALIEAQNQNTDSGARNTVQLLQLFDGFAELQQMMGDTEGATSDLNAAMRSTADIAREREQLELQLLRAEGDTVEIRRRELAALNASNRPLQERLYAIEDEAAAAEQAAQASKAAQEAAREAQQAQEQLWQSVMSGVQIAYQEVERSIDAERQILQSAYQATVDSINGNIQTVQTAMQETSAIASTLGSSLNSLLDAQRRENLATRREGQRYLQSTLASGGLGDRDALDRALGAVSQPSEGLFSSFTDYQRDFYQTANVIAALESRAEDQIGIDEQSLRALERQLKTTERQHEREMASLDRMLEQQQLKVQAELGQVDWLQNINGAVLSVTDAIAALQININTASASGYAASSTSASSARAYSNQEVAQAASDITSRTAGGWDQKDAAVGRAAIEAGVSSAQLAASLGMSQSQVLDRARELGLPKFRDGGVASGPMSGYLAELHGTELVFPMQGGAIPLQIQGTGDNGLLASFDRLIGYVKSLEEEVKELKSISRGTASHTSKISSTLDRERREREATQ